MYNNTKTGFDEFFDEQMRDPEFSQGYVSAIANSKKCIIKLSKKYPTQVIYSFDDDLNDWVHNHYYDGEGPWFVCDQNNDVNFGIVDDKEDATVFTHQEVNQAIATVANAFREFDFVFKVIEI